LTVSSGKPQRDNWRRQLSMGALRANPDAGNAFGTLADELEVVP